MCEEDNSMNKMKILGIVHLVSIVLCILGCIYTYTLDVKPMPKVLVSIAIVAMLCAVIYGLAGYNKKSELCYRVYMIVSAMFYQGCACANAALLADGYVNDRKAAICIYVAVNCLLFGILFSMSIANDISKRNVYILCALGLVVTLGGLIMNLIFIPGQFLFNGTMEGTLLSIRSGIRLLLVSIAWTMASFRFNRKVNSASK